MIRPCLAIEYAAGRPSVAVPLRLATDAEAVITQVAIRVWTLLGTWGDDVALGVPWLRLSGPGVADVEVEAVVRRQARAVPGVLDVLEVTVGWAGVARAVAVRVLVESAAGPVEVAVGDLGIAGIYAPGAWYIMATPGYRPIVRSP
jgi:hypothetical protein